MRPTKAAPVKVALKAGAMALHSFHSSLRTSLALTLLLAATGCAQFPFSPKALPSEGHITAPAATKAESDRTIPPPARVSEFVPPPKPSVNPQTYSVVVNEVPVKDLLLALARDTKQNID